MSFTRALRPLWVCFIAGSFFLAVPQWVFSQCCPAPTTENSVYRGISDYTLGEFDQAISDSANDVFDSLIVTEFAGGSGTDTCHFTGSAYAPFTTISGGYWHVSG